MFFKRAKTLQTAKQDAKRRYGKLPGVKGFGIGDDCIRVYIRDKEVEKRLPNVFEGKRFDFVVINDIVAD